MIVCTIHYLLSPRLILNNQYKEYILLREREQEK